MGKVIGWYSAYGATFEPDVKFVECEYCQDCHALDGEQE